MGRQEDQKFKTSPCYVPKKGGKRGGGRRGKKKGKKEEGGRDKEDHSWGSHKQLIHSQASKDRLGSCLRVPQSHGSQGYRTTAGLRKGCSQACYRVSNKARCP